MLQPSPRSFPGCRACRSTRSGSGPRTQPSWRCWRSSPRCRCPPRCCSRSCPCSSPATTPSAPPRRCTPARCTSPWRWSRTALEVPRRCRGLRRRAWGGEQGKSSSRWETPPGVWQRCDFKAFLPAGGGFLQPTALLSCIRHGAAYRRGAGLGTCNSVIETPMALCGIILLLTLSLPARLLYLCKH